MKYREDFMKKRTVNFTGPMTMTMYSEIQSIFMAQIYDFFTDIIAIRFSGGTYLLMAFSLINSAQLFRVLSLFIFMAYHDFPVKTCCESHSKFHQDFHNLFMMPFFSSE